MAYSHEIADSFTALFEQMKLETEFAERNGTGLFTIRMRLRCRLQNAQTLIIVREKDFTSLTQIPLSADENHRLPVAEFLTRVNYNMRNGNFEMNMETGEVRFKSYGFVGEGPANPQACRLTFVLPFMMFDRIGDALLDVMFDAKSPREAFESLPTL